MKNKSPEQKLLEAIMGTGNSKNNEEAEKRRSGLIKLKEEILNDYANSEVYSALTSSLIYFYNKINFDLERNCMFEAVFYASRIFQLLGSNDKFAFAATIAMFKRFVKENKNSKDANDFSVLYYKKDSDEHCKGEFKIPFDRYIEVAFDIYANSSTQGINLLTVIFDDVLSTARKLIASEEFINNYYHLEDKYDAFYDLKKYDLKSHEEGVGNILWLLNRTANLCFRHTIKCLTENAPALILKHEKEKTFYSLLTIATYNRMDFCHCELESSFTALDHRLERLYSRYVKFDKHWTKEVELMLYNDLLEIVSDPYAIDDQVTEDLDDNKEAKPNASKARK